MLEAQRFGQEIFLVAVAKVVEKVEVAHLLQIRVDLFTVTHPRGSERKRNRRITNEG